MNTDLYPEVLATVLLFLGLWMISSRVSWSSVPVRMVVVALFVIMNVRYVWWRLQSTMPPFVIGFESLWSWFFIGLELSATLVITWHFIVLISPSRRSPEADVAEAKLRARPEAIGVDILIPTYNEPEEILQRTIDAAVAVDYPNFRVWVLDDGARDWLKQLCLASGVAYVARTERKGFKAGNLNHALTVTSNPLVSVVDADFALEPNFLWRTAGLLDDPSVGLVQTPQYFKNPDAIQYNLFGEKAWPEAQCMFSDVMQSGRDTWDNAFCYGTGFVVKRACLEEIGGFPEQTITEDLHSTYVLLSHGYKTRFLNERLSAGFATQDIGEFVLQRARWCAGSLQCLFAEGGVLRGKRLSILDRLFFLDPVLYHVGTLWTFCLLISPAIYWWFGVSPFRSDFGHLFVVFAPRMLIGIYGFYWLTDRKTIPLVSELGRIVGIYYLVSAMAKVALNPFRQSFNITSKKLDSQRTQIYWHVMRPHLLLLAITGAGILYRYGWMQGQGFYMQDNVGLMISLTIYVAWLVFFSCLICVQRPTPNGLLDTVGAVSIGSIRATMKTLFTRMFVFR
ncbi:glycosyltransferase family 2 protein [Synoicihabitans lomoniglobus]|uniref:Cellulose synthase catalytic subunit n=1 Tax=Synoicihabitans lomoniglobus TaxID=2909285 RepID=A0AAE9ZXL8_9BACT|nr:cellulose synthase catalytic subunit [Opitutaceae bacterium LMO-M01]WED64433.1 cellulose synthase catalytic subunit [Opitutaceae bacterium LMO-M01]